MAHCGITIGSLGAKQSSEKRRKGAVGPNGLGNVDPFSLASWVVPSTVVSRPVSRRAVDIHHLFYLSYDAQLEVLLVLFHCVFMVFYGAFPRHGCGGFTSLCQVSVYCSIAMLRSSCKPKSQCFILRTAVSPSNAGAGCFTTTAPEPVSRPQKKEIPGCANTTADLASMRFVGVFIEKTNKGIKIQGHKKREISL